MKKLIYFTAFITLLILSQGCEKETSLGEDPYGGGKAPLGVVISQTDLPSPAIGIAGTIVTFKASGLLPYKDQIAFLFNGEKGEVIEITATTIKVRVPAAGSSGITSIAIGEQLVIGPQFTVTGLINRDVTFKVTPLIGTDEDVNQFYPLQDGRALVLGYFTNYNNQGVVLPINRIARTTIDGEYDRTFRTGKGANGGLFSVVELSNRFIIVGSFSGYNQRSENISNITSLFKDGSVDTVKIQTARKPTLTDTITQKWFPRFNGGTNDQIRRVYSHGGKILATGNFRYYVKRTYTRPNYDATRDTVILDSTEIRQILRFNLDGSLDKTFRFNTSTNRGNTSGNGQLDSYMHTEADKLEKLVVFGNFTTFDGQPGVGRILRLNADGSTDPTFTPGTGANNSISSLTYNATTRKYVITGIFTTYNGQPAAGIAVLNENGTLDNSFAPKLLDGGYANFARQISTGQVVVSGDFKKYNNITRNGFMVLTPTGELAAGYNATGPFQGYLNDIVESKSADGKKALTLIGRFNRFDNQDVRNIIRVTIE